MHVDNVDPVDVAVDTVTHKDPAIHIDREADGFLWEWIKSIAKYLQRDNHGQRHGKNMRTKCLSSYCHKEMKLRRNVTSKPSWSLLSGKSDACSTVTTVLIYALWVNIGNKKQRPASNFPVVQIPGFSVMERDVWWSGVSSKDTQTASDGKI